MILKLLFNTLVTVNRQPSTVNRQPSTVNILLWLKNIFSHCKIF
ncbi:hypothetical protein [Brachyspira aalborgi]|nr:hypothetical protein [Brachyspira aalborgi]